MVAPNGNTFLMFQQKGLILIVATIKINWHCCNNKNKFALLQQSE